MGCNCGGRQRNAETSAQLVITPGPDASPESIAAALENAGLTVGERVRESQKAAAPSR